MNLYVFAGKGGETAGGKKQTECLEDWLRTLKYVFVVSSYSADSLVLSCL